MPGDESSATVLPIEELVSEADIDARNLESAIYNLLLSGCQAAARSSHVPQVEVQPTEVNERIYITILANGPGVPASVRRTLFEPFVSAGKHNITGLGLTLARRIAEDQGGSVYLENSNRERTVFALSIRRQIERANDGCTLNQ
jgi:signal transduction histidine kinase